MNTIDYVHVKGSRVVIVKQVYWIREDLVATQGLFGGRYAR